MEFGWNLPDTAGSVLKTGEHMVHRLAAVLAADMVGYSRLMEIDEGGTLARLRTHRIDLIEESLPVKSNRYQL